MWSWRIPMRATKKRGTAKSGAGIAAMSVTRIDHEVQHSHCHDRYHCYLRCCRYSFQCRSTLPHPFVFVSFVLHLFAGITKTYAYLTLNLWKETVFTKSLYQEFTDYLSIAPRPHDKRCYHCYWIARPLFYLYPKPKDYKSWCPIEFPINL